ncbi:hypothetical protein BDV96DRAFT_654615 [Lophiotrema nucula]|uniref:Uncharacterized protein n=1 Tax=Lophiotrema nucula TaxID=690887 RepID=A0A6A5YHV0_9PLEO|nr:hypothetical protein BDV96DRAFT_654615 [Lophiotrema nucula]
MCFGRRDKKIPGPEEQLATLIDTLYPQPYGYGDIINESLQQTKNSPLTYDIGGLPPRTFFELSSRERRTFVLKRLEDASKMLAYYFSRIVQEVNSLETSQNPSQESPNQRIHGRIHNYIKSMQSEVDSLEDWLLSTDEEELLKFMVFLRFVEELTPSRLKI